MDTKMILNPTAHNHSPPSAQLVMSNEDLLTEILLRVPIGSLLGLKLVSKQWHSLITDPRFSLLCSARPTSAVGFFFNGYKFRSNGIFECIPFSKQNPAIPLLRKLKFIDIPQVGFDIVQSCNGLLLCSIFGLPPYHRRVNRRRRSPSCCYYYICNPTTKKFVLLPQVSGGGTMSLVFDPAKSRHYKVLHVAASQASNCITVGESQYQIEIYSSDIGFWRKLGQLTTQLGRSNRVYWNGAIHWIKSADVVHCFNVDQETLHSVQMPLPARAAYRYMSNGDCLVESRDHLYYMHIFGQPIEFDIYEMKRDHSEWVVKYRVDLSPLMDAYPEMIRDDLRPIYHFSTMVRGETEEESFLVLLIPEKFIRYYFVNKTCETLWQIGQEESDSRLTYRYTCGFHFIESLCPV